jgi:hypothetical protein
MGSVFTIGLLVGIEVVLEEELKLVFGVGGLTLFTGTGGGGTVGLGFMIVIIIYNICVNL